jgi:hypothetical protein
MQSVLRCNRASTLSEPTDGDPTINFNLVLKPLHQHLTEIYKISRDISPSSLSLSPAFINSENILSQLHLVSRCLIGAGDRQVETGDLDFIRVAPKWLFGVDWAVA